MKPEAVAPIAAAIALLSLTVSIISVFIAGRASRMNERIFKRQKVIDLYNVWLDIKQVDSAAPIAVDVVRAVNALGLTAALWNHDIIEREILFQSYWPGYKALYDSLADCSVVIPQVNKMVKDCITNEIKRAYNEILAMEVASLNRSVKQTKV